MMMFPSIYNNDLFDDLFDLPVWNDRDMKKAEKKLYGHHAGNLMKTDIKEKDKEYELHIDLPGFDKDEIQVSLDNGYITIQASKGLDKDEDEKDGKWIHTGDAFHLNARGEYLQGLVWTAKLFGADVTKSAYVPPALTNAPERAVLMRNIAVRVASAPPEK